VHDAPPSPPPAPRSSAASILNLWGRIIAHRQANLARASALD
jgi:hypothetical protein